MIDDTAYHNDAILCKTGSALQKAYVAGRQINSDTSGYHAGGPRLNDMGTEGGHVVAGRAVRIALGKARFGVNRSPSKWIFLYGSNAPVDLSLRTLALTDPPV